MRKLKFRAYSKSHNKMFDNGLLENAADGLYNIAKEKLFKMGYFVQSEDLERGVYLPTKDNDLVFMQYTGFEDMNNREIYEGDIVEIENETRWEVIFNKGCFKRASIEHPISNLYLLGESPLDSIEVIGNIYENPELLG